MRFSALSQMSALSQSRSRMSKIEAFASMSTARHRRTLAGLTMAKLMAGDLCS
jgi:hypothetical protein